MFIAFEIAFKAYNGENITIAGLFFREFRGEATNKQ